MEKVMIPGVEGDIEMLRAAPSLERRSGESTGDSRGFPEHAFPLAIHDHPCMVYMYQRFVS